MTRSHVKPSDSKEETRNLAKGKAPMSPSPTRPLKVLADVSAYSATHNAYQVVTKGVSGDPSMPAGQQLRGVPRKVDAPGTVAPLPVGTTVIIDNSLGFPFIDGVLSLNTNQNIIEDGVKPSSNLAGDSSPVLDGGSSEQVESGFYREPGAPADVVGGDWTHTTPDGNRIGATRGNYNVMDAGPGKKAKLEQFGDRDLTRITTEDFELNTGFGMLSILNTEGRSSLSLRAASDQLTESGGSDEQWTFKLDIGASDEFFNMEVCSPDGKTLSKVGMTTDGRLTLLGTNGVHLVDGSKTVSHLEYASGLMTKVLGKMKEQVRGEVSQTYESSRSTEISESDTRMVGRDDGVSVSNNQSLNVGGSQQITVSGGDPLEAKPTNLAVEQQVLNGSYYLEVGNPQMGANPAAFAGITLAVNNGAVTLGQSDELFAPPASLAQVNLNTVLPNSVALGGTVKDSFMHAVLYEPLIAILTTMISMYDAHVHFPPIIGPPLTLMAPTVSPQFINAMSTRVVIGA